MPSHFRGRVASVLLVAALAQLGSAPAHAATGDRCEGADALPGQVSYAQLGRATLCLINYERGLRGLRALRAERRLALAARRHAHDMVRNSYFAHSSPSGAKPSSRIARCGYLRGATSWWVGENLAWGAGTSASPRGIVRTWMNSPGHRANILKARFRDLGVGVTAGLPVRAGYGGAVTYVHDFGVRQ